MKYPSYLYAWGDTVNRKYIIIYTSFVHKEITKYKRETTFYQVFVLMIIMWSVFDTRSFVSLNVGFLTLKNLNNHYY